MKYFTYVIQRETSGKFYIGVSENPEVRLEQHNSGVSKWTKGKGPWKLVWFNEFETLSEARKMETLLKKQKGGNGFYKITGLICHNSQSRLGGIVGSSCYPQGAV